MRTFHPTFDPDKTMILRLMILLSFILTSHFSFGDKLAANDTTQAQHYFNTGYDHYDMDQYDSAIYYFQRSLDIYNALGKNEKAVKSKIRIGEVYWRKGNYDSAKIIIHKAMNRGLTELGRKHAHIGDALRLLGSISGDQGNYEEAAKYAIQALKNKQGAYGEVHKEVATVYNSLGLNLQNLDLMDSSLNIFTKALKIWEKLDKDYPGTADTYSHLGALYYRLESPELAIKNHEKSLKIRLELYGENSMDAAISYHNIAEVYRYQYRNELALKYLMKSLKIKKEKLGEVHWQIASSYFSIGNVSQILKKYDEALEYFQKSYRVLKEASGERNPNMVFVYTSLGQVNSLKENYKEAESYFDKALELAIDRVGKMNYMTLNVLMQFSNLYLETNEYDKAKYYIKKRIRLGEVKRGKDHSTLAPIYYAMGRLYAEQAKIDSAEYWYERSLAIRLKENDNNQVGISMVYDALGNLFKDSQEFIKAFDHYQKAIIAGTYEFDNTDIKSIPELSDIINDTELLRVLSNKSLALEHAANTIGDSTFFEISLNTLLFCDTLINESRNKIIKYNDQITLGALAEGVYKIAVRICTNLYQSTLDPRYRKLAFYFIENSKANALDQGLSTLSAKNFTKMPEELLKFERSLKQDISKLITAVNTKESEQDSARLEGKKEELFKANLKLDSLRTLFETNYPKYHDLKYKRVFMSPKEMQDRLNSNEALIEYFEGDSALYTFVITSKDYQLFQVQKTTNHDSQIIELNKLLNLKSKNASQKLDLIEFSRLSSSLGKIILEQPILYLRKNEKIDHLMIIPDGKLYYLPFEILLTDGSKVEKENFKELNYLVKDYSVSYGYSARLRFKEKINNKSFKKGYLGYAPSYATQANDSTMLAKLGKFRDEVIGLVWNEKEVQGISKQTEGEYRVKDDATESNFKKETKDYSVVHLAMHALVDNQDPMNSKLVFNTSTDTIDDGYLHAYELFNMEMNPELVVLSACNTGYGKLEKGEGVMSLAYGFAYAGCPSIVMSQWLVNDYSTKEIMLLFYKYLNDGLSKDQALRKAKLDFLNTSDIELAHPGYWAPFVLVGDNSPLSTNKPDWALMISILFVIAILITIIYPRQKQPS